MGKIERIIEEAEAINAKKLNLGDMGLKEAPADLKRLEKLELLTLSNNKIKSLPATFFTGLPRLESLNLFNNGLKEIPANINTLSHLRTLLASVNSIKAIPRGFGSCPSLTFVDLSFNQIDVIPANIGFLTTLRVLHLADNKLTVLPPEIGKLTQLETLVLRDNSITAIPAEIGSCSRLKVLFLQNNLIEAFPREICGLDLLGPKSAFKISSNPIMPDLLKHFQVSVADAFEYMRSDQYDTDLLSHRMKAK